VDSCQFSPLTSESLDRLVARARRQLAQTPAVLVQADIEGWQRAVIYKLLVLAGLRRSEMVGLRVHSIDLENDTPFLVVGGVAEGSPTNLWLPLRADLVTDLKRWLRYRLEVVRKVARQKGKPVPKVLSPDTRLFRLPAGLIKALERDLRAAGIPPTDAQGQRIDLHAARGNPDAFLEIKGQPIAPPGRL